MVVDNSCQFRGDITQHGSSTTTKEVYTSTIDGSDSRLAEVRARLRFLKIASSSETRAKNMRPPKRES
jgi:hypothetical protein